MSQEGPFCGNPFSGTAAGSRWAVRPRSYRSLKAQSLRHATKGAAGEELRRRVELKPGHKSGIMRRRLASSRRMVAAATMTDLAEGTQGLLQNRGGKKGTQGQHGRARVHALMARSCGPKSTIRDLVASQRDSAVYDRLPERYARFRGRLVRRCVNE